MKAILISERIGGGIEHSLASVPRSDVSIAFSASSSLVRSIFRAGLLWDATLNEVLLTVLSV